MEKLANENPRRLFTFGCSFTKFKWSTWANILAYELDCEFHNFGKTGAGNQHIASQISQAHNYYDFNENDLIVVCWTNIAREDRYILDGVDQGWVTPGNIYTSEDHDKNFAKKYANEIHFALRDFPNIEFVYTYLSQLTNFNFISMCEIDQTVSEFSDNDNLDRGFHMLVNRYRHILDKINPSFFQVLWDNDLEFKTLKDQREIHRKFGDNHPTILEHYQYLQSVFDYEFSKDTENQVHETHETFKKVVKEAARKLKKGEVQETKHFEKNTSRFILKESEDIPQQEIYH